MIYCTRGIMIYPDNAVFPWCDTISSLANNLKNTLRFRQRQLLTASKKDPDERTDNENDIVDEFISAKIFNDRTDISPCNNWMSYDTVFKHTNNPDYYAKGLPRQSSQHIIKQACSDMDSFYAAVASYKKNPGKFKAKPELPGYNRKGGHCSVVITNQDCTITEHDDGKLYAGLPFAKKFPICIGNPEGRLKQAVVTPVHGIYKISFTFEIDKDTPAVSETPKRITGIDFGVDNLMAVTNNCGLPCLLYKGGINKSANHYYNKKIADIVSRETSKPDCPKGKDGLPKFRPTKESELVTRYRNNLIMDQMHKTAKHFITWCVENRIDTIVAGVNSSWKQSVSIGKVNNQNFVQIPHSLLRNIIKYLCNEHGIRYVEQEESYTSKASFIDFDPIPTYGVDDNKAVFSGKRKPKRYKGMYKPDGFRGLYCSSKGTIINSDLNGSANIIRKAFPDAFTNGMMPLFNDARIIRNADREFSLWNQTIHQISKPRRTLSRSKARRLKKKLA